jgi:hypothetical protein
MASLNCSGRADRAFRGNFLPLVVALVTVAEGFRHVSTSRAIFAWVVMTWFSLSFPTFTAVTR